MRVEYTAKCDCAYHQRKSLLFASEAHVPGDCFVAALFAMTPAARQAGKPVVLPSAVYRPPSRGLLRRCAPRNDTGSDITRRDEAEHGEFASRRPQSTVRGPPPDIASPSVAAGDNIIATEHVGFEIYTTPYPRAILPGGKGEFSGRNLSRSPDIAITNFNLYGYQTDNVFLR